MTGEASRVTAKFEDEYLSLNGIIVTLGARGFSWAVSDFGQVLKIDPRENGFAARVFGLRPNTCRPAVDETKFPVVREKKPLVPRVYYRPM